MIMQTKVSVRNTAPPYRMSDGLRRAAGENINVLLVTTALGLERAFIINKKGKIPRARSHSGVANHKPGSNALIHDTADLRLTAIKIGDPLLDFAKKILALLS